MERVGEGKERNVERGTEGKGKVREEMEKRESLKVKKRKKIEEEKGENGEMLGNKKAKMK